MKPVTREWIEKAEKDILSARRELHAQKDPNFDLACFLAQQAIEKCFKARLQEASIRFDKTHDLLRLLDQLIPIEPLWDIFRTSLRPLSAYAIVFRYPGRSASKQEARDALEYSMSIRKVVRESLGLPVVRSSRGVRRSKATKKKEKRKTQK